MALIFSVTCSVNMELDAALNIEDFQEEEFYTKYEPLELLGKLVFFI